MLFEKPIYFKVILNTVSLTRKQNKSGYFTSNENKQQ